MNLVAILLYAASAIAALITAAITASATLLGVRLNQRGNERQKRMEMDHAENLKRLELQEQRDKERRAEKRAIYQQTLEYARRVLEHWQAVGDISRKLPTGPDIVLEEARREINTLTQRKALTSGLEMDASTEVTQLLNDFHTAITQCRYACQIEYEQQNIINPRKQDVLFKNVRAAVVEALREERAEEKYLALRSRIREELDWADNASQPVERDELPMSGEAQVPERSLKAP